MFQYLIGRVQRDMAGAEEITESRFQYLIGRVQSEAEIARLRRSKLFQYLIGRVQRKVARKRNQCQIRVSIPYR